MKARNGVVLDEGYNCQGSNRKSASNMTELQKVWQKILVSIISFEKHKKLKSLHPL